MSGTIATSTAVALSWLPPPDMVEPLDYELILQQLKDELALRLPEFDRWQESDPAMKLLKIAAYRELILRQGVNDAGRAFLHAYPSRYRDRAGFTPREMALGLCGPASEEGDAETGWIDWLAPRAGATRIWSPLSLGEQILLLCPDGQLSAAVALPGLWRDIFASPSDKADVLIQWPDDATVRYNPDAGATQTDLPADAALEANAPAGLRCAAM